MRIDGHWLVCGDDLLRPVISGEVLAADGTWHQVTFLVDSGADSTALTAETIALLGIEPTIHQGVRVEGVGGAASSVVVDTRVRFTDSGGQPVAFPGEFLAFTQPGPLELNYLGRNILKLFAVVVDRRGDAVCLVRDRHRYVIQES